MGAIGFSRLSICGPCDLELLLAISDRLDPSLMLFSSPGPRVECLFVRASASHFSLGVKRIQDVDRKVR